MSAFTTPQTPLSIRRDADALAPGIINVRRGGAMRAETPHGILGPQVDMPALTDTVPLPTVLRLPDLGAIVERIRTSRISIGAVAQWTSIAMGGLLALWLIFGGVKHAEMPADVAPAFVPGAMNQGPSAAPAWQAPTESTAPAFTPPSATAAPPAAAATGTETLPSPTGDPVPPQLPEWDESAGKTQSPPAGPAIRTAQREPNAVEAAPTERHGEAPPLGITVPVRQ